MKQKNNIIEYLSNIFDIIFLSKKSEKINAQRIEDLNIKKGLDLLILEYISNSSEEVYDKISTYVKKNFYVGFEYIFVQEKIQTLDSIVSKKTYHIYYTKGYVCTDLTVNDYSLKNTKTLIKWYKEHLQNEEFRVDYQLEISNRLEFLEKYQQLLIPTPKQYTNEELSIIRSLEIIKPYLIKIAINYFDKIQNDAFVNKELKYNSYLGKELIKNIE